MNIKRLIQEGENIHIDFKQTISSQEKIARTMVSFANTTGGKLLIGVSDKGMIIGVHAEEEERYMIEQAALLYCHPALTPNFEELEVDHKLLLIVTIPEGTDKPYRAADGKVYIRVNDHSILVND